MVSTIIDICFDAWRWFYDACLTASVLTNTKSVIVSPARNARSAYSFQPAVVWLSYIIVLVLIWWHDTVITLLRSGHRSEFSPAYRLRRPNCNFRMRQDTPPRIKIRKFPTEISSKLGRKQLREWITESMNQSINQSVNQLGRSNVMKQENCNCSPTSVGQGSNWMGEFDNIEFESIGFDKTNKCIFYSLFDLENIVFICHRTKWLVCYFGRSWWRQTVHRTSKHNCFFSLPCHFRLRPWSPRRSGKVHDRIRKLKLTLSGKKLTRKRFENQRQHLNKVWFFQSE